jgi:hypothetical protein
MNEPKKTKFEFGDGTSHDATVSETSQSIQSCYKYEWALAPIKSGLTVGDPTYTIEVSNDDTTWFEYNNLSTNVSVDDAVDDNHLAWVYMRVVYNAGTETTGTIEFELTQKQQA